jgi:hypothetical protein
VYVKKEYLFHHGYRYGLDIQRGGAKLVTKTP